MATKAFGIEFHLLMEQVIKVTSGTSSIKMTNQMLLQTITSIRDVVLLQDASDDDEISNTQVTVKDPSLS